MQVAGLASFTRDLVIAYAHKIKCEYLNIRAEPGITFAFPELYDELLSIIAQHSRHCEVHRVPGTHHIHLQDAPAVAPLIAKFLTTERASRMTDDNDFVI